MAEKKKKEKVTINLPKARASMKRSKEVNQMKQANSDMWSGIGIILAVGIVLFILLGGVSQKGVWEAMKNWSHNIGETVSEWFEGGDVVVNDDGVYWDPTGTNPDGLKKQSSDDESSEESEDSNEDTSTNDDAENNTDNNESSDTETNDSD
jgi:hypothetical protein